MTTSLLKDRYELLRKLGSGGFSTVFAAMDTLLDREVAIKVLKASLHEDEELVTRFLLEAKLTSKLSHPNTLTVHDFGRDDQGHCFFVTELLIGQSLHDRLYTKALSLFDSLSIVQQIAQALSEAHCKAIVHRDIKPGNIFLCQMSAPSAQRNMIAKLLDFGIAKSVGFDGQTVTGQMMGTPTYMSPEQIVNIKEVDQRTDIYSLGIVFYHMICGSPPFKGDSYFDTMRMHMQAPLPPLNLKTRHKNVYQALTSLLKKMTAKDKQNRHQNTQELVEDINKIQTLVLRITAKSAFRKKELKRQEAKATKNSDHLNSDHLNSNHLNSDHLNSDRAILSQTGSDRVNTNHVPIKQDIDSSQTIVDHLQPAQFKRTSTSSGYEWESMASTNVFQSLSTDHDLPAAYPDQDHDDVLIKEPEESLKPSYGWRESLKEDSISENPLEFLREVQARDLDLPPPLDPFATKVSNSKSRSSSDQVISSASASIKLTVPAQVSHKVTMTEKLDKEENYEVKTSAIVSSSNVQMNLSAKPQNTSQVHSSKPNTRPNEFSFDAGRDNHLSVLVPSPPKMFRVLILDPNQYASQLYQKGIMAGVERRSKERKAKGINSSDLITVTLSNSEVDLKEDLEWGADLLLVDLKAKDGNSESEGVALIKSLKKMIPNHCYLIALCKGREYADDALQAGADRVLMKPVRNRQLFDTLAHYLWPTSL
ncbi:MAG: hypothetical protein CMH49_06905 [Myxococcales bacterium]|nr:hypothetical protein [Myxococcales bacterium]